MDPSQDFYDENAPKRLEPKWLEPKRLCIDGDLVDVPVDVVGVEDVDVDVKTFCFSIVFYGRVSIVF